MDILHAFVQLVTVPQLEKRLESTETITFSKISLMKNPPLGILSFSFRHHQQRDLGGVCAEVRGYVCVLQLLSVTLKAKRLHLRDILKTGFSLLLRIESLM